MALSMTGYGRAKAVLNGRDITVEIKSVNSRYFEYSSRLPRSCAFLDDSLKKMLGASISRGKVELSLQMQSSGAQEQVVDVNLELARSYRSALRLLSDALDVKDATTVETLANLPDVLTVRTAQVDEEQLSRDVSAVCAEALQNFLNMRAVEGEKLRQDLLGKLDHLEEDVARVEQNSAARVEAYTQRLYAKLEVLLADRNVDEARVLTEAAIFADKTAVDEETVRLRSHIAQYRQILNGEGPVGRKLDFLTQELNRETNTIGSKCQDLAITRVVLDMKAEIEKIREQIQNLE